MNKAMNDDNSQNNNEGPSRTSFLGRLGQLFNADPKDRQELVEVFRDSEENELIDHDTRDMLEGVMSISERRVRDIMIPRSQIVAIEREESSLDSIINLLTEAQHSRYPVINETKDHIEGILLAKDLLKYLGSDSEAFSLDSVLRPAVIVPESKRIDRLLKEFRQERYHMAIVIDEFGGVSGLVTIEDILEEIVGEIEDEYDDDEEKDIKKLNKRTYAIDALTSIDEFNETFHTQLTSEEVDTIGGLVITHLGHVPERGDIMTIGDVDIKVTAADTRRVMQVQITLPDNITPPTE